jgi:hypothetical protein
MDGIETTKNIREMDYKDTCCENVDGIYHA